MKILLLCEGKCEQTIMDILLDNNMLTFTRDDLIERRGYPIRYLCNANIVSALERYNQPVKIYRIIDKKENLAIPKQIKHIVPKEEVYDYITKPELEILLIINENLYGKFSNMSNCKASVFAKENILYNGKRYEKTEKFLRDYYGGKKSFLLLKKIKEYKKKKKKQKDLFLADLLK